jgi:hypothetical protein
MEEALRIFGAIGMQFIHCNFLVKLKLTKKKFFIALAHCPIIQEFFVFF